MFYHEKKIINFFLYEKKKMKNLKKEEKKYNIEKYVTLSLFAIIFN